MKLNHEYVRDILIFLEENLENGKYVSNSNVLAHEYFKNHKEDELAYALKLLYQENYITSSKAPVKDAVGEYVIFYISQLTWQGHELLDNIRDKTIWKAVQKKSLKLGIGSIKVLATTAHSLSNALMSDPNAIQNFNQGIENIGKIFGIN